MKYCCILLLLFFTFRASPILLAIGVPESIARNALRLSVGRETTLSDIDYVVSDLKQAVQYLQDHATWF